MKCEATVTKHFIRAIKSRLRDDCSCRGKVKFKINDKYLCSIHAAIKALDILSNRNEIMEIK